MKLFAILLFTAALVGGAMLVPAESMGGSGDKSFFALKGQWQSAARADSELGQLKGKRSVVALFYTSCRTLCPMTTANLKKLFANLSAEAQKRTQLIMVSVDVTRDTREQLAKFAQTHEISSPPWLLLAGRIAQVRELASVLGMGFGDQPANKDLHQMHSLEFAVLDVNGEILGKFKSLNPDFDAAAALLSR